MKNKGVLSILTNFGCHFACKYCVYRENGINIPFTNVDTFGWSELEQELKSRKGELISISGGGDPLYRFNDNSMFYRKLFDLLAKYDCKLELHTSIIDQWFPYDWCERVVFHFTMPNQIRTLQYLSHNIRMPYNVRVVYVVQEHYSKHLINEIVREVSCCADVVTELSFRQMIDKNGKPTYTLHDYLKNGHKKDWYYIEQCDYNEYFVHSRIEKEYLKIK